MKKNMGSTDRIIRLSTATLIAVLYVTNVIEGTLAMALGVVAVIFAATSFVNFCPLYSMLGINTCQTK
ncbi:MAG: DUF2892 domain-containing protein [Bacteroidia bacterium]|jgi:hypothetical protein